MYPAVGGAAGGYRSDGQVSSFYPRLAQSVGSPVVAPPAGQGPLPKRGSGIRMTIKPELRLGPPVQLSPYPGEIPHSSFQFDFDVERRIVLEAEQQTWPQTRDYAHVNGGPVAGPSPAAQAISEDPVVGKYLAMGLPHEAVSLAVATYGDVQNKVLDFCASYSVLHEMGFAPEAISGALGMYDNDREKALAYLAP